MFAQFGHLIHAAFHRILLPSLVLALCLVPLSLLSSVFFLALCKCVSASWHTCSPDIILCHRRQASYGLNRRLAYIRKKLPARFARLPWMTSVVVAATSTSVAETMATAPLTVGLGFGLVDGQCSPAQIGPVERRDRLVGFTGIGHFDESETTGAARIPIGHECDLLDRAMCLENTSQLRFSCTVGQIPNIKVLHRNSSLSKSSKLVGVAVGFGRRPSESRGGAGSARIAWVRAMDAERAAEIRREAAAIPQR